MLFLTSKGKFNSRWWLQILVSGIVQEVVVVVCEEVVIIDEVAVAVIKGFQIFIAAVQHGLFEGWQVSFFQVDVIVVVVEACVFIS